MTPAAASIRHQIARWVGQARASPLRYYFNSYWRFPGKRQWPVECLNGRRPRRRARGGVVTGERR